MTPVFLWQADGPASEASGMTGDRDKAQEAAAERLLSGRATSALVEEAVAEVGAVVAGGARQSHYRRTGEAWLAADAGQDGIEWVPVNAETGKR